MPWSLIRSDDAVSESLGFIIIIGIMITSVGIIFVTGFPVYNEYVDQSHMQNMIEGFDLVSENANNVALLKTPYQQSELKLYEGTIAVKDAGTIFVECLTPDGARIVPAGENSASGDSVTLKMLEYSKDDSSIAYLLGGVFKKDRFTYPVIKKPVMYTYIREDGTQVLVMPLISLSDTKFTLAGNTLARISFGTLYNSKKKQVIQQPDARVYDNVGWVQITLESDYNDCLLPYFRDDMGFQFVSNNNGKLIMKKQYVPTITVNTIQSTVIATINTGSV